MPTLAELMDQLRGEVPISEQNATELPKKKPLEDLLSEIASSRSPASEGGSLDRSIASLFGPQKKSYSTSTTSPEVEMPVSRLDQAIKNAAAGIQLQAIKADKEKADLEEKARAEGKSAGTISGLPAPDMALTLKTIADEQRRLEGISEKMVPKKGEPNLWAEAALAFLPTLVGGLAGRGAGGVGMVGSGIASGAQAGLAGLSKIEQLDQERRNREASSARALLERETALSKEKIQALKEAELVNPKAAINMALAVQKGMGESFGKELQKSAAKAIAAPGKEQQMLEIQKRELEKLQAQRAEALGRGGQTVKKAETEVLPAEGGIKERIGPFVVDPEKYQSRQITKADSERVVKAQTAFQNLDSLLSQYEATVRKEGIAVPLTENSKQQQQTATNILNQLKELQGYGALQAGEIKLLEKQIPNFDFTLKNLLTSGLNSNTFPNLVRNLSTTVKSNLINEAKNRGYQYQPQIAEKPTVTADQFKKMSPSEQMKTLEKMRSYKESLRQ